MRFHFRLLTAFGLTGLAVAWTAQTAGAEVSPGGRSLGDAYCVVGPYYYFPNDSGSDPNAYATSAVAWVVDSELPGAEGISRTFVRTDGGERVVLSTSVELNEDGDGTYYALHLDEVIAPLPWNYLFGDPLALPNAPTEVVIQPVRVVGPDDRVVDVGAPFTVPCERGFY